jgi:hypothetical protein
MGRAFIKKNHVQIQKLKSVTAPNKEVLLYANHENPRWRPGSCRI